ncbi:armadillo-type protein [Haematococcus lacustris]
MGRGMPPASASSLVALLSLGGEGVELPCLALDLLPRTTLDAACRAALAADPSGLALLLQHVSQGQAGALEVMHALARDSRLKAQCGAALNQEVQRGQGVAAVLGLLRSQEPEARMAAVQALRPLLRYGPPQVQSEVLQADPLPPLVDVLKQPAADVQAVAEVMTQLASASPALLSAVVASLAGLMASPSTLPPACTALLLLSGAVQGASGLMAQGGLVGRLAAALASLPPASQLTPTRLLVALVQAPGADLAGQEGALRVSGLLLQLLSGQDLAVRAAAAAGLGSMMRASAKTRQELSSGAAPGLLLDLLAALPPDSPQLPEVAAAVACLACLEGSCRPAVITRLRALLQGGQGGQGGHGVAAAQVCAHLSHSPKGRALVLSEQLVSGLVRLLTSGSPAAQCGAADALTHVASGGAVALPGVAAPVLPRAYVVERGAVEPLVKMLRAPDDGVVVEAALLLDCLSACEEGSRACRQAKAREALQEVLQRGKRGELGERAVKAAYAAYMQLL